MDIEPSWPYTYPRNPEYDEPGGLVVVNDNYSSLSKAKFDKLDVAESFASSLAPAIYDVGRIDPFPALASYVRPRPPKKPRYNPPRLRPKKVPVFRVNPMLTTRQNRMRLRKFLLYTDKLRLRAERHRARVNRYNRNFPKRLDKFYALQALYERRVVAQSLPTRFKRSGRQTRWTERHPYTRIICASGSLVEQTVYSSRTFHLSETGIFPNNANYRTVEVDWHPLNYGRASAIHGSLLSPLDVARMALPTFFSSLQLDDLFNQRLLRKVSGKKLDVAVLVGEGAETVRLASDLLERFADLFRALRRKDPVLLAKAMAGHVLLFDLGLKPFISDLTSLLKLLTSEKLLEAPLVVQRMQTRHSDSVSGVPLLPGISFTGQYTASRTLFYQVENPLLRFAAQLGLTNPFSAAWELIPLSFVVDWIVSVGESLERLSSLDGLSAFSQWDSLKLKGDVTSGTGVPGRISESFWDTSLWDRTWDGTPSNVTVTSTRSSYLYVPDSGSFEASFRLETPFDSNAFSGLHWPRLGKALDAGNRARTALALLTSVFTGGMHFQRA